MCVCVCVCVCFLFTAAPAASGGSQARGPFGAIAAGLDHSHSDTGCSRVCDLHHSSRHRRILNPLSEAGDRTPSSWTPCWVLGPLSHRGNSCACVHVCVCVCACACARARACVCVCVFSFLHEPPPASPLRLVPPSLGKPGTSDPCPRPRATPQQVSPPQGQGRTAALRPPAGLYCAGSSAQRKAAFWELPNLFLPGLRPTGVPSLAPGAGGSPEPCPKENQLCSSGGPRAGLVVPRALCKRTAGAQEPALG